MIRFNDDEEYPEFNFDEFMDDILRSKPTPSHKCQPDITEEDNEEKEEEGEEEDLSMTNKLPSVNSNRSPLKATDPVHISPRPPTLPPLNLETTGNLGGRSNSAPDSVDKFSEPSSTVSKLVFIYSFNYIYLFVY